MFLYLSVAIRYETVTAPCQIRALQQNVTRSVALSEQWTMLVASETPNRLIAFTNQTETPCTPSPHTQAPSKVGVQWAQEKRLS